MRRINSELRLVGNLPLMRLKNTFLFEFLTNLSSHPERSLPNLIPIRFSQRSPSLFRQIYPNSQILMQYSG